MIEPRETAARHLRIERYNLMLALTWTVLIGSSMSWSLYKKHQYLLLVAQGLDPRESLIKR